MTEEEDEEDEEEETVSQSPSETFITCSDVCICKGNVSSLTVNCSNANLSHIPDGIPTSTQFLYFNKDLLSELNNDSFRRVEALVRIDMKFIIKIIRVGIFECMTVTLTTRS